jgi:hypothetical protein
LNYNRALTVYAFAEDDCLQRLQIGNGGRVRSAKTIREKVKTGVIETAEGEDKYCIERVPSC